MRQAVIGLLAHVDAGKTTLAEALLYRAGAIRARGRVDHGDSHLDTDAMERARGITIFSSQATLEHGGVRITLVDAPGHVDFSAEAERTLAILDMAMLVIGANDGVTGHTATLWRLLERYSVPTVVFVNKMDLEHPGRGTLLAELRSRLGADVVDVASEAQDELVEEMAATDEAALEEYLEQGTLAPATVCRLVRERRVFPCFFGSALRDEGISGLLDGLTDLVEERIWPQGLAARVYKVTHERGERVTWLKLTGGDLKAKDAVAGSDAKGAWSEKVNQLRVTRGVRLEAVPRVVAGELCAVTGLTRLRPGDTLGDERVHVAPQLAPVLAYRVEPGSLDVHAVFSALRELADEDPMLAVAWDAELKEIRVQLMGAVQLEVVRERLAERLGSPVDFGPGSILYRETVAAPTMGYGHFEPLRHYAEVHVRLEPLPRGSGVVYGSVCSTDDLDLNWQRLALGCAMELEHRGTLAGAPITDVRITLVSGRAHLKHTEGGDFRQAAWRAIRQGLMSARKAGALELLEPWYRFSLALPADKVGRALADLQRMSARFGVPDLSGEEAVIEGTVPASEVGDYPLELAAYTSGRGSLELVFAGYDACHDAERVIEEAAYEPEADLPHTPDSVFCAHGAGYVVPWHDVPEHIHVHDDPARERPWREADAPFFGK